jgi:hypothetical protein
MRLLNLLGVYLGPPENLIPERDWNPKGSWEQQRILDLNVAILERLGGSWYDPPTFSPGWESAAELADLRHEAQVIIREDFEGAALWGWKQPQSCLTLPFWQKFLPDMRYVICLRSPLDVARSWEQAGWAVSAKVADLWLTYTAAAISHTGGKRRTFVFYEDYFENWQAELRRLAEFIESPIPSDDPELQSQVEAFIQEELRHYRSTVIEAVDAAELPFSVKSLYFSLRAIIQGYRSRYLEGADDREELEEALNIFSICAKEERTAVQQKDALLAERDVALAEKDAALAQGEETLAKAEHQLEAIRRSFGYRLLQAYRLVIRWLFPPGSLRGAPYWTAVRGLRAVWDSRWRAALGHRVRLRR